jgi:tRNA A-37 threonylcarbamoyl transferase component Bud32
MYDVVPDDNVVPGCRPVLEHIPWPTLGDCDRAFVTQNQSILVENCLNAIERLHEIGVTHGEITEENILANQSTYLQYQAGRSRKRQECTSFPTPSLLKTIR